MGATTKESEDRVAVQNPNGGRESLRIRRSVYEPVRRAILAALDTPDGLANSKLRGEVERTTPPELWAEHSPGWYTTTVKLDLEARGLLAKSGSPQHLRLTDAGRDALTEQR